MTLKIGDPSRLVPLPRPLNDARGVAREIGGAVSERLAQSPAVLRELGRDTLEIGKARASQAGALAGEVRGEITGALKKGARGLKKAKKRKKRFGKKLGRALKRSARRAKKVASSVLTGVLTRVTDKVRAGVDAAKQLAMDALRRLRPDPAQERTTLSPIETGTGPRLPGTTDRIRISPIETGGVALRP